MPHAQTVNALRVHFRNWVMNGPRPPDSVWPRLNKAFGEARGKPDLVEANKQAMGFATIPAAALAALPGASAGWRTTLPEASFINPVLDYDWGPEFDASDASGVPTNIPSSIKRVIKTLVPHVNADGNEIGGVPVVLNDAPLGTCLG